MTNIKFIALAAVCIILSMITSTYAASTVLRSRQIGTGATNTYVAVTDGTDTIWTDPTTLPGGAPPGNDTEIPYNDSGAWAAEAAFTYQTGTNTMGVDSINVTTLNTSALTVQNDADITGDAVITGVAYITEQAAASGDTAGDGQVWVKDDTPNELWFTDDAGTDYQLTPLVIDTDTNVVVIDFSQADLANDTWAFMDGIAICSATDGWIPMRDCSITGMSVQVNAPVGGLGASWDIEVYVNGGQVWFDTLETAGDQTIAFQTQAAGTDSVTAGQNVSVMFDLTGGGDHLIFPHVLIELTYD